MAGLVLVISLLKAGKLFNRDHRHKAGDDVEGVITIRARRDDD
jgi:hypothetical protein